MDPACRAFSNGNFLAWELGNEPDLFPGTSQYAPRPPGWNEQDFVNEWLNGTRAIRQALQSDCPDLATDDEYKYIAPGYAGTNNALNAPRTFADGLDNDSDISIIASHKYVHPAPPRGLTHHIAGD